ncbi:MAG: hypothetical protein H6719_20500 [Sandaracinaceae bacterium]|nr:hypothetical protein [Sandaracinaceae bacterium]
MLKTVGRIRLVSELASDPWTTTRGATAEDGAPVMVRLGKFPVRFKPGDDEDARFGREADQAQGIDSPHLAPVLDRGVSFAIPWVVHPTLPGRPLSALLEEHPGPLAPQLVALIGRDVASALTAAHACEPPLVHHGVGLHDLWLHADRIEVCLLGYGLSRVCFDAARAMPPVREAAKAFASPEQLGRGEVGPASDVFSLAATLLALATGEPVEAGDPNALEQLPAALRLPLSRALGANPAGRGSAVELRAALEPLVGEGARAALAARFGLEPGRPTDVPVVHEGAPAVGVPLDSVTKEVLLPEALASYRSYRPAAAAPAQPSPDPFDDDLGDDLDWAALIGDSGDVEDLERRDTAVTTLPADIGALYEQGEVFEQMPTFVGVSPQLRAALAAASGETPLEPTLELPLPTGPAHGHERATEPPALPAASFGYEATAALRPTTPSPPSPPSPPPLLKRVASYEVQGWPLSWLVGLGLAAVVMVAVVALVTAMLAS